MPLGAVVEGAEHLIAAPLLERPGLIGHEAEARDARLAYVVLTKASRQRVSDARATLERMAANVFRDRRSGQDIASLAELLGRLTAGQPGSLI